MPFAAGLSTTAPTLEALDQVCSQALNKLAGTPQLAFLFFSPHHAQQAEALVAQARRRLGTTCLLGCSGEGIVGDDQEIEQQPAMSLWLAQWSYTLEQHPFHLTLEETAEGHNLLGWPDALMEPNPAGIILLLGDPFTFPANEFLRRVNENNVGLPVIGGMASGANGPGQCPLLLDSQVFREGAVGVFLRGTVRARTIVSQGCRPIGRHMVITRAHENIVAELSGKAPMSHLQDLWKNLDSRDRQLFQQGLHVGRVINEYQGEFQRGDFLIRNVLGLESETGAMALTDSVRVGQTIQFHVRDAMTADEDLHALLKADRSLHPGGAQGALLFTCNGRGSRLFGKPHHDARVIRAETGEVPLAGFFAQGEIGPIGGQNFIHGFTASVLLLHD